MAEPATELNSLKRVSIVQQVEQVIADRIVDGTYAVDTKLPAEMTLSKQLGVGRGTVREAFRLLEAKGLVEIRPGRGAFVASDKEAGTEQTVQWFRGKAITEKAEGGNVSVVNISNISDICIDYANLETINEEARKVARYLRDVLITTKWFSIMWVSSQVALFMIAGWSFLT